MLSEFCQSLIIVGFKEAVCDFVRSVVAYFSFSYRFISFQIQKIIFRFHGIDFFSSPEPKAHKVSL